MLRIFRSVRRGLSGEGSAGRYLRYAIGEIALVVIGILIALQINNWNEDRLDHRREHEYLDSMLADLREDIGRLDTAIRGNTHLANGVGELVELLDQPLDRPEVQRQIFLHSVVYTYWYLRVDFSELTMAQLKSSGGLRLIEDADVRRAMLEYEQGLSICKFQYTQIEYYFHTYEKSQKQLLNMSLARQAFALIEDNYLNMLEPLETFEPLVPVGPYLIDDDPKRVSVYLMDLMFYRTALKTQLAFLKQQKTMAEALIELIHDRYGID